MSDSANDRVQRFKVGSAIVVTKNALPDDPQDFDFTAGGGLTPTSFQLDDDADNTLSNSRTFIVDPGSGYSVAESAPPPGWDLIRRHAPTARRRATSTCRTQRS